MISDPRFIVMISIVAEFLGSGIALVGHTQNYTGNEIQTKETIVGLLEQNGNGSSLFSMFRFSQSCEGVVAPFLIQPICSESISRMLMVPRHVLNALARSDWKQKA